MSSLFYIIGIGVLVYVFLEMSGQFFKETHQKHRGNQQIMDALLRVEANYLAIYHELKPPSNDFERALKSLTPFEFEDFLVSKWREKGRRYYEWRISTSKWEKELRQLHSSTKSMALPIG